MSQAEAPAADWYQDPSGRFQFRYWDGEAWTGHVSTDGKTDWDPPADDQGEGASTQSHDGGGQGDPDDATWAPQAAAQSVEPAEQTSPNQPEPEVPVEDQAREGATGDGSAQPPAPAQGGTIEQGEPSDANLVANLRAGLDDDVVAWVNEVAAQVEPRLSRINRDWTAQPQAEAARACAYGLLVGHLARIHPHMRPELSQVAESHPSFTTLESGARLDTLEQIAGDPERTAAWLGPLIGNEDPDQVAQLFD